MQLIPFRRLLVITLAVCTFVGPATGDEKPLVTIEGGFVFTHFQQQIKANIGDPRGQRLVEENMFGLILSGTYAIHRMFALGAYAHFDRGKRALARFDGFDDEGKTQVRDYIGGYYTEFWFGPLAQFRWRTLTVEAGYALVGSRKDDGRSDIPTENGSTEGAFSTHPTIAWMFSLGAGVPLHANLDLTVKIQYRARYYHRRGGERLIDDIDHGTQSIVPLIGLAWSL
jgi:hypothetical protein